MTHKSRTYDNNEKVHVKPNIFNIKVVLYIESLILCKTAEEFRTAQKLCGTVQIQLKNCMIYG